MFVKNLIGKIASRGPVSVVLAVVLSVLVVTATVGAATTISTNINTGGTLTVTGASALNGNVDVNGMATTTASTGTFTTEGNVVAKGTLSVGASGSAVAQIIRGSCFLVANASIAATSTGYASCAVSSGTVTAGDLVFVTLSTTTSAIGQNFVLVGAQASTTSATTITVKLLNLTGDAAVPAATAGFGSSTQYLIIR